MKSNIRRIMEWGFNLLSKIVPSVALNIRQYLAYYHEAKFFKENFEPYFKNENMGIKINSLLTNLDNESVLTVQNILNVYYTTNLKVNNPTKVFSKDDMNKLKQSQNEFFTKIKKINNNEYRYDKYILPVNIFDITVLYYKHGIEHICNKNVIKNKSFIDVGGFIGDSILVLNELSPQKIYTFEAIPDNYKMMQTTLKLNGITNVIAENVALGGEKGEISMSIELGSSTSLKSNQNTNSKTITVPMISLDEYVEKNNIEVGLIKVDIEGAEPEFLKGAKNTICKQKPVILLSIYHNAHDFFELKPLIESWQLGYTFKIYKPVDGAIVRETLLICEAL